jgi:hypothetical protein
MKIWETLVGVRDDLPSLRQKWWHRLSIVFVFVTAFLVFFVAAAMLNEPIKPTPENVFSLSLTTFAKGRPGQVTQLTDLAALRGSVAILTGSSELAPLVLHDAPENIRCEAPAKFRARQTFVEKNSAMGGSIAFTAIPDSVGQPDGELRHCAATPAYASLAGQQVVSYSPNSTLQRWRSGATAAKSLVVAAVWLIVCLNIYYRGIVPVYAARRRRRTRSPAHSR